MTARRISMDKAALANVFESFRSSVTALREKTGEWQSWDDATEIGYSRHLKELRLLRQQELSLDSLANMVAGRKQERNRASQGGLKSRFVLVMCDECGYKLRSTRMWFAIGIPKCPNPACDKYDEVMTDPGQYFGAEETTLETALDDELQEIEKTKNEESPFPKEAGEW